MKTLEEQIEDYLFSNNIRWSGIHTMIVNKIPISFEMKTEYEKAISDILSLIKSIVPEEETSIFNEWYTRGWNKCRQQIINKIERR